MMRTNTLSPSIIDLLMNARNAASASTTPTAGPDANDLPTLEPRKNRLERRTEASQSRKKRVR